MQEKEATFGRQLDPKNMAEVLGIKPADLDERFPVEEVSTGLPHIIVPLKTLESVRRIQVARDKYFALIEQQWARSILVFCQETYQSQNQVNVRIFAEYYAVPEDPATGSGNGCLAGYLVKHHYWGSNQIDVRSEQGYEIDRPSLLLLQAQESDGQIAKGEFI
jgi:trans-2,3-dihydro-3-hydroxyanthranilate isomerase